MLATNDNIKTLRTQKGLSQEELATLAGYTDRSSIAKIESGKVDLSESKILIFARVLGVSPAALMGVSSSTPMPASPPPLAADETRLLDDYRDASEEIREEAAGMLHRSAERNREKGSSMTA